MDATTAKTPEFAGFSGASGLPKGDRRGCYDRLALTRTIMYVEFLGIPRERAGVSELEIDADTLGQLVGLLAVRFPAFGELMAAGRLHPSVAANLNGDEFVRDPETPLGKDDRVLILSADAGG